ncbi:MULTISPECIES: hypothetical protein [Bacteroides]|nr:hypothetical protein [Bacteroides acidifaciens]MCR1997951.1 hypothetical protein [Bacteroides acidifaciens]
MSSLLTGTPALGSLVRNHWLIESMHWPLDFNAARQDKTQVGKSRPQS